MSSLDPHPPTSQEKNCGGLPPPEALCCAFAIPSAPRGDYRRVNLKFSWYCVPTAPVPPPPPILPTPPPPAPFPHLLPPTATPMACLEFGRVLCNQADRMMDHSSTFIFPYASVFKIPTIWNSRCPPLPAMTLSVHGCIWGSSTNHRLRQVWAQPMGSLVSKMAGSVYFSCADPRAQCGPAQTALQSGLGCERRARCSRGRRPPSKCSTTSESLWSSHKQLPFFSTPPRGLSSPLSWLSSCLSVCGGC